MPTSDRKLRVFVCHASQDKPIVRELYQRLIAEGWIDPWLDEIKLLPGVDWKLEIPNAVRNADVVLVCVSENSLNKRGYVQRELKFALDVALDEPENTIFIIPLRLDNCILPNALTKWQYADYFPNDHTDFSYGRLLTSLKLRAEYLDIKSETLNNIYESQNVLNLNEKFNIQDVILMGENERVEFRSSMVRDIYTNQENQALIMVLGKEIVGMLNSFGGLIIIGVGDDGSVLGIEGDFEFLGRRQREKPITQKFNIDVYGLKIIDLIRHNIGSEELGAISFSFKEVEEKTLCVIEIQSSSQPVYFGKAEDFYIRRGTSTLRLSPRETISYIRAHW